MNFFFIFLFTFFLFKISTKYKILLNYNGEKHQKFTHFKNIPLIGGPIIAFSILFLSSFDLNEKIFFLCIFSVGIISDFKLVIAPSKRLLIQFIVILLFVYFLKINIVSTRFFLLDYFLNNASFSIIFTSFCFLILINGTNFIDGNNGNVLFYYLIVLFVTIFLKQNQLLFFVKTDLYFLFFLIIILLIFNLANKLYLGDSGSFILSLIFGFILIKSYLTNLTYISPFFVTLCLWYPAFENLFSIIRKSYFLSLPTKADNNHLHQLLYFFLIKKFNSNKIFLNNAVSILINLFNLIIIYFGMKDINNTQFQIFLILVSIFIYLLLYLWLLKYKKYFTKK